MLPIYLFIFFALVVLCVVSLALYVRAYRRHVNRVLHGAPSPAKPMPAPFHVTAAAAILLLLSATALSFLAGASFGYHALEDAHASYGQLEIQCFYAEVQTIGESTLTVSGIPLNDPNYQGSFTFQLYDQLPLWYQDTPLSLTQLSPGDLVSITLVKDGAGVEDVFQIRLLSAPGV